MYNPSARDEERFKICIRSLMTTPFITFPVWQDNPASITVHLEYALRRPLTHFVNRNRNNILRNDVQDELRTLRAVDIDNLVKFTLDCLNGIVFSDDKCITEIHAVKILDNDFGGAGRTTVRITRR